MTGRVPGAAVLVAGVAGLVRADAGLAAGAAGLVAGGLGEGRVEELAADGEAADAAVPGPGCVPPQANETCARG